MASPTIALLLVLASPVSTTSPHSACPLQGPFQLSGFLADGVFTTGGLHPQQCRVEIQSGVGNYTYKSTAIKCLGMRPGCVPWAVCPNPRGTSRDLCPIPNRTICYWICNYSANLVVLRTSPSSPRQGLVMASLLATLTVYYALIAKLFINQARH